MGARGGYPLGAHRRFKPASQPPNRKANDMWAPRTLPRRDRGASAVEYGLLIAGIAAMIVLIMFAFGTQVIGIFQDTCASIDATAHSGTC